MQPGACRHDSTYLARANGCSRRPRAWAWGDIAHLVRCRAVGGVPERDRDCTYQVLAVPPGVVHRVCRLGPGPGLAQPEAVSWVGDGADGSPGLFAESAGRRHDERVEGRACAARCFSLARQVCACYCLGRVIHRLAGIRQLGSLPSRSLNRRETALRGYYIWISSQCAEQQFVCHIVLLRNAQNTK